MKYRELLKTLRPYKFGTSDVESFDEYINRVSLLLPNWPECPHRNWLYRHYDYFVDEYAWLGFDVLRFSLTSRQNDEIYQQIGTHKLGMVDSLGKQVLTNPPSLRSWLQDYILNKGTWPVPIMVLENYEGIIGRDGEMYGQPYHLLEGHLRLGYFRNLYRQQSQILKKEHPIWIVS